MVVNKLATRTHRQRKTCILRVPLFCFVTKTSERSVGPKSLRWLSPFPLICWCSFLERRPVCVTTASAAPVQGQAEASQILGGGRDAGWERPRMLTMVRHPAWPQLIWKPFWKRLWNVMKVGWRVGRRPRQTYKPLREMIKDSYFAFHAAPADAGTYLLKMPLLCIDSWMLMMPRN